MAREGLLWVESGRSNRVREPAGCVVANLRLAELRLAFVSNFLAFPACLIVRLIAGLVLNFIVRPQQRLPPTWPART
jgi:hypothetical protein